jgi:hypothetical protein
MAHFIRFSNLLTLFLNNLTLCTLPGSFLTENAPGKVKNHPISMISRNLKF